ncbi:16S rRNA pseudouridine(516) synthase RsuA [Aurantivibrio infirmus]
MRLDKFISHSARLSRNDSKRLIKSKTVCVNDEVVTNSKHLVSETDIVTHSGEVLAFPKPQYLMLYKPTGYVSATTDSEHPTVIDLLPEEFSDLSIAGRLDLDASGLLLLSDDGKWLHRVTSPKHECTKTYIVELESELNEDIKTQFAEGIMLNGEDKPTKAATLRILENNTAEVCISEGRYHQVKRMFAACGNHVKKLHRHAIGSLVLDNEMKQGDFRKLTEAEINGF